MNRNKAINFFFFLRNILLLQKERKKKRKVSFHFISINLFFSNLKWKKSKKWLNSPRSSGILPFSNINYSNSNHPFLYKMLLWMIVGRFFQFKIFFIISYSMFIIIIISLFPLFNSCNCFLKLFSTVYSLIQINNRKVIFEIFFSLFSI